MLVPGDIVGAYRIEAPLGGGGFASVYRVQDDHGQLRALKVLDPKLRRDDSHRARFLDEARVQLARLSHPNIVKVYEILSTSDVAALVMEYVDGVDLSNYIESRREVITYAQFLEIALPILDAVEHAHRRGVIHRDLKPANVLLAKTDDLVVPKLTDFGIAKVVRGSAKRSSTATGMSFGTTGYMSPEQIVNSKNVHIASDVFSLGVLLYELAAGVQPFVAESDYEVMHSIMHGEFRETGVAAPHLPPAVTSAIDRALSPDPRKRFLSCAQFANALASEMTFTHVTAQLSGGSYVGQPDTPADPWPQHDSVSTRPEVRVDPRLRAARAASLGRTECIVDCEPAFVERLATRLLRPVRLGDLKSYGLERRAQPVLDQAFQAGLVARPSSQLNFGFYRAHTIEAAHRVVAMLLTDAAARRNRQLIDARECPQKPIGFLSLVGIDYGATRDDVVALLGKPQSSKVVECRDGTQLADLEWGTLRVGVDLKTDFVVQVGVLGPLGSDLAERLSDPRTRMLGETHERLQEQYEPTEHSGADLILCYRGDICDVVAYISFEGSPARCCGLDVFWEYHDA